MSARNELALDIFLADNARQPEAEALVEWEAALSITAGTTYAHGIADGLIAKGYRKPRTITTVEEVSALPNGSQIQDADPALCEKVNGRWYMPGSDYDYGDIHITLPATVLHEPEPTSVNFALATAAATGVPMTEAQVRDYITSGAGPEAEATR